MSNNNNNNTTNKTETGWFKIAKTGKFKDMFGRVVNMTKKMLQEIAANYIPGENHKPAPATLGHPKHDDPKYATVSGLKQEGNFLLARLCDVSPELVQLIKEKKYAWVSPVIRLGENTLKALGILGGYPGAIPLPEIGPAFEHMFEEGDEGDSAVVFSFAELDEWKVNRFRRIVEGIIFRLRDHLIETQGAQSANKIISEHDIKDLGESFNQVEETGTSQAFAEMQEVDGNPEPAPAIPPENKQDTNLNMQKIIQQQENQMSLFKKKQPDEGKKINAPPGAEQNPEAGVETPAAGTAPGQVASFAEEFNRERALRIKAEKERDAAVSKVKADREEKKKAKIAAFCDSLMEKGKLAVKARPFVEALLDQVDDTETASFAEGMEGAAKDGSPLEQVMAFAELIVETNIPVEPLPRVAGGTSKNDDENEAAFGDADEEQAALDQKVKAQMAQDGSSYSEALEKVRGRR